MGPAAGLHVADVLGIRDVGDVEDPDAAQSDGAHRVVDSLAAAVDPPGIPLTRNEEEVLVDRDVALGRGTVVAHLERRFRRLANVPHLIAVVIPLNDVGAGERQIGIGGVQELARRWRLREHLHVPRRLSGDCLVTGRGRGRGRRRARRGSGRRRTGESSPQPYPAIRHRRGGGHIELGRMGARAEGDRREDGQGGGGESHEGLRLRASSMRFMRAISVV